VELDAESARQSLGGLADELDNVGTASGGAGATLDDLGDSVRDNDRASGSLATTITALSTGYLAVTAVAKDVFATLEAGLDVIVSHYQAALDYSDALSGLSSRLEITKTQADTYADRLVRMSKYQLDNVQATQLLNRVLPVLNGKLSDNVATTELAALAIGLASERGQSFESVLTRLAQGIGKNSRALDEFGLRGDDATFSMAKFQAELERVEQAGLTVPNPLEEIAGAVQNIHQEFLEAFVAGGGMDGLAQLAVLAVDAAKWMAELAAGVGEVAAKLSGPFADALNALVLPFKIIVGGTIEVTESLIEYSAGLDEAMRAQGSFGQSAQDFQIASAEEIQAAKDIVALIEKQTEAAREKFREQQAAADARVAAENAEIASLIAMRDAREKAFEDLRDAQRLEVIGILEGEQAARDAALAKRGFTQEQIDQLRQTREAIDEVAAAEEQRKISANADEIIAGLERQVEAWREGERAVRSLQFAEKGFSDDQVQRILNLEDERDEVKKLTQEREKESEAIRDGNDAIASRGRIAANDPTRRFASATGNALNDAGGDGASTPVVSSAGGGLSAQQAAAMDRPGGGGLSAQQDRPGGSRAFREAGTGQEERGPVFSGGRLGNARGFGFGGHGFGGGFGFGAREDAASTTQQIADTQQQENDSRQNADQGNAAALQKLLAEQQRAAALAQSLQDQIDQINDQLDNKVARGNNRGARSRRSRTP
jgi:hypothetical protein